MQPSVIEYNIGYPDDYEPRKLIISLPINTSFNDFQISGTGDSYVVNLLTPSRDQCVLRVTVYNRAPEADSIRNAQTDLDLYTFLLLIISPKDFQTVFKKIRELEYYRGRSVLKKEFSALMGI